MNTYMHVYIDVPHVQIYAYIRTYTYVYYVYLCVYLIPWILLCISNKHHVHMCTYIRTHTCVYYVYVYTYLITWVHICINTILRPWILKRCSPQKKKQGAETAAAGVDSKVEEFFFKNGPLKTPWPLENSQVCLL